MHTRRSAFESSAAKRKNAGFRRRHAEEHGLQMNCNEQGAVESVTCRFCIVFGRDVVDGKRRIEKPKTFRSFRADNYKQHLTSQHAARWAEYQRCRGYEKISFFGQDAQNGEESVEEEFVSDGGQQQPAEQQQRPARNKKRKRRSGTTEAERATAVQYSSLHLKERELRLRELELEVRREELGERKKERLGSAQQHEKQFGLLVGMMEMLHQSQAQLLGMIAGALGSHQQL